MGTHLKAIICGIVVIMLCELGSAKAEESPLSATPFRELIRLQASDAAPGDIFGYHLSLSDDGQTLAVGACGRHGPAGENAGGVYVFVRTNGTWIEQARLQGDDTVEEDSFGLVVGVSADGNTLVVGAPHATSSGGVAAGSAYVFTRSEGKWAQQVRLQAEDAAPGARFGSVAISRDGSTIAVGAYTADAAGHSRDGATYIFIRVGNTWVQQARLQASDPQDDAVFGVSVALSSDGNTLASSAYSANNSGGARAGSIYIFTRSGVIWTEQARLQASDATAAATFGTRVALSADGNTLGTGAYHAQNSVGSAAGNAYVFVRSEKTWTEEATLRASDAATGDNFGTSPGLSADGNIFVVGAINKTVSGALNAGGAYVFVRTQAGWKEQMRLHASDAEAYDYFGMRVDISGDGKALAISAYGDNNSGGIDAGSVYIFTRAASGSPQ
jgi:hypothetical protein